MGNKSLYFFVGLLLILAGCSNNLPPEPSSGTIEKTPIVFKMKGIPSSVVIVKATLTRNDFDTIYVYLNINNEVASGTITKIAIGTWHLKVDAQDNSSSTIFTGQTDVDVLPGGISNVNLTLTTTTGGININVTWGPTNLGNAIYLDGKTSYIEIPNSQSLSSIDTAITMEAWVKPVNQYYNTVISKGSSNYTIEFAEGLYPGIYLWGVNTPLANTYWGRIIVPAHVSENRWTHIAVSYSQSSGVKTYINGVLVYQTTGTGFLNCGSLPLRIGARFDSVYPEYFNGVIDDVRLWKVIRSQTDISQNMYQELTGSEYGLVGYWKFNEQAGSSIIHDATLNHNDGLIHGNVIISSTSGN